MLSASLKSSECAGPSSLVPMKLCFSWKKLLAHSLSDPDQLAMHFGALVNDIIRLMFNAAGIGVPWDL